MNKIQWKSKRTIGVVLSIFMLYLMLRIKSYKYYDFVILPKIKPTEVWEFIADFSNMKHLNPTIIDFNIISESGTYEHWKYSTQYSENLSHWPHFKNFALAHFDIKSGPEKNVYFINSVHTTCVIFGQLCLESTSQFKFSISNSSDGALCEEYINYECPAIFSAFCQREVEFQRTAIMTNLKEHFQHKRKVY